MKTVTELVIEWINNNRPKLTHEADRRETSVGDLVLHMLDDVMDVYLSESDLEVLEYRLSEQEGLRTTYSDSM